MKKYYLVKNHNGARIYTAPTKKYQCEDCTDRLNKIMKEKNCSLEWAKKYLLNGLDMDLHNKILSEFPLMSCYC